MKFTVYADVAQPFDYVEIRLFSKRNDPISRDSDVREEDPSKDSRRFAHAFDGMYNLDYLFPVVDIRLNGDMQGVALFEHVIGGWYKINPMFHPQKHRLHEQNILQTNELENWENWLLVGEPNARCTGFYLRKQLTACTEHICEEFETISDFWSGHWEVVSVSGETETLLATQTLSLDSPNKVTSPKSCELNEENLRISLNNSLRYLLDSIDHTPNSPMCGGLNLFYDRDAATYRQKYWLWTYAPAIQAMVRAADCSECAERFGAKNLLESARGMADVAVRHQMEDKDHPANGLVLCRYDYSVFTSHGYDSKYSPADGLMLAGIGMLPLYKKTADLKYLNFCKKMADATGDLLELDTVIQQDYYPMMESWKTNTVNESGFGMEGLADLYLITKDEKYKAIGKKYIDQLIAVLEDDCGLWAKNYFRHSGRIDPNDYLTRGMAWAMMGLTSAYRMTGDTRYLDKSKTMAKSLMDNQMEDGSWSFYYDQGARGAEKYGISEKGTAAWCYLFYRMYHMTGEQMYLDTARKALKWLMKEQYMGSDVQGQGGIYARTPQSGVVSRAYFALSCSYTVSFFALSVLEELDLLQKKRRQP